MPSVNRTPKKRTPQEQAEVFAGRFANHVQGLAHGDAADRDISNALINIQKVLGKTATFADAATAFKKALPTATMGPHPDPADHVLLNTRIDNMVTLLAEKNTQAAAKTAADLDHAIQEADALSKQLTIAKTELESERNTLQQKPTRTSDEDTKILVLKSQITSVETAHANLTNTTTSAKTALNELPTSKNTNPTLVNAITLYAAQTAGEKRLKELKTVCENATTEQYRQTNELFTALGGGIPPKIDSSVIMELKKQTNNDATKKTYDTIKEKIDTINNGLEELNGLQAKLALPAGATSEGDKNEHQKLLEDIAQENTKLAKMFRDAQDLIGAHAALAKQSRQLEELTTQLRIIPSEKVATPILGNTTLELTKDALDQKFTCGYKDWDKMEKKWKKTQLDVHPTREDLETFVTNWNKSVSQWNENNPLAEQRKTIELKGNPPYTISCGNKENRDMVLKEFIPAMKAAEKARTAATVTSSVVPAATTPATPAITAPASSPTQNSP